MHPRFRTGAPRKGATRKEHSRHSSSLNPTQSARRLRFGRAGKLLSYYRPHIPMLAADLVATVLVSAMALAIPLCANYVTKHLVELPHDPDTIGRILLMGLVMLGFLAVEVAGTFFIDYQGHMMGTRIESAVRRELFEHCQKLSFSFHDRQRTGQLMSRITNDTLALGELFHHGPEDLAITLLKFFGALAVLWFIDVPLTLMIVALTPFAVAYALFFSVRMNRAIRVSRDQIAAVNERVEDSLAGIRVVQSFANEPVENHRFKLEDTKFFASRRHDYLSSAWFSSGVIAFAQLIAIGVIVLGGIRVVEAEFGVADLLTVLLCVSVLVDPIRRLTNVVRLWQEGYTGFERVMEILEVEPDIRDAAPALELAEPRGLVTFDRVDFRYEEDGAHVLTNLSFEVEPGEFVALVGSSGVGKSTLCALIPRFYEVTGGRILIDGRDIRELGLATLRRAIGIVQQDVYLFGDSVAENLRYGRPDATDDEIVAAARAANAHDFIMALPKGYDTNIGQRGVKLSGGQRQRLTIARAFLKDPAILIFDEATSALDNESERAIQEALQRLSRDRTTIVIAHRLSTIQHADRILVLTEAGIAEQGTHASLIAAQGAYARLYEACAGI